MLVLTTQGYTVTFQERGRIDNYFDYYLDFLVDSDIMPIALMREGSMSQGDLISLANYLEKHVSQLQINPNIPSHAFVTYDGEFQLQALEGDTRVEEDQIRGSFTLLFLINAGRKPGHHSTYIGGQSTILLKDVVEFATSLRNLASTL